MSMVFLNIIWMCLNARRLLLFWMILFASNLMLVISVIS